MGHFNSWHHHDRINTKFYDRYFADIVKMVEEGQDADRIVNFLEDMSPVGDDIPRLIASYEEVLPKLAKSDRATIECKQHLDTLKRRQRAYELFESTRPKL